MTSQSYVLHVTQAGEGERHHGGGHLPRKKRKNIKVGKSEDVKILGFTHPLTQIVAAFAPGLMPPKRKRPTNVDVIFQDFS